jgi:DNA adenine methylase
LDEKWCKVMLSNHNTPFIREIYSWFRFEIVKARRNINTKIFKNKDTFTCFIC